METLFNKRPALRTFFESTQPILEYTCQVFRQKSFKSDIRCAVEKFCYEKIEKLFSKKLADNVVKTLQNNDVFSSADHHGPLTFPLLINTNIIYLMAHFDSERPVQLVFSCSGVPLNNISYPRGLYFRGRKIPLIPCTHENSIVYAMPKVRLNTDLSRLQSLDLKKGDLIFLKDLFNVSFDEGRHKRAESYAEQIMIINDSLWRRLLSQSSIPIPPLVYVPLEEITTYLFESGIILKNELVGSILFDKRVRSACINLFENIEGAWKSDQKGTHFFWGIRDGLKSSPLFLKGERLCGKAGDFPLTSESLLDGLRNKHLYAGLFLCYLALMFAGGYILVGGFNQVEYLTKMKEKLIILCEMFRFKESLEKIQLLPVNNIICGPKLIDCEGIDIIMGSFLSDEHLDQLGKVSLSEALNANLDDIYKIVS